MVCKYKQISIEELNKLENLTFLCPNCHSQTDNFSGKNAGK